MARKPFSFTEKLAAALLLLRDDTGKPLIDPERAKRMSAKDIIACFDFDHTIPVAIGGTNEPWNVVPRLRPEHRHKTAKIDIPQIAKTKRLARANDQHVNRMLRKTSAEPDKQPDKPKRGTRPMPSRPFQKGHRPMRGRG